MSIHKMLQLDPDVDDDFNELLATAVRCHVLRGDMHELCRACVAETMDMTQCIRVCSDCADVCAATSRLAVRRAAQNVEALRLTLETCARICDLCAEECERHDEGHCKLCAGMCRECAADCRAAQPRVNGMAVTGWKVETEDRERLLARFAPRWPDVIADHVTLDAKANSRTPLPEQVSADIVGEADDGAALQANGYCDRRYHRAS